MLVHDKRAKVGKRNPCWGTVEVEFACFLLMPILTLYANVMDHSTVFLSTALDVIDRKL